MTAAALTAVTKKDITSVPCLEVVHGTLAASGDYYDSKFSSIKSVQVTPSVAQVCGYTKSGNRVTIATAAADVDLLIIGE